MKRFDKDSALKKLEIKQNKNTYIKRLSISLSCLFLILVVMLFTFAKYESNSPDYTLINGKVESSSGDFNIVSYVYDGTSNSEPPSKNDGYILTNLTCTNATGEWDDLNWKLTVSELSNKAKCTLTFDKNSNYQVIEYNTNGGYMSDQYIKGTIGQQIGTLPTPIKNGYTFDGWYKESDHTNLVESTTIVDSSLDTLYAKYSGSGQANFRKTYVFAQHSNANSGDNGYDITIIDSDNSISRYAYRSTQHIGASKWYEDDFFQIGYGMRTSLYNTIVLKQDAIVDGVERSAGYEITLGFSAIISENVWQFF